jgi:hypothetical protein
MHDELTTPGVENSDGNSGGSVGSGRLLIY